jgi:hypothetical protein
MPRHIIEELKPQLHRPKNLKPRRIITLFVNIQVMEILRIVIVVLLE